jgi:hypothetical protein
MIPIVDSTAVPPGSADRRRDAVFWAALACVLTPLILFAPRLFFDSYVPGSDAEFFYFWADQFGDGLDSGLWYPRWAWTSHGGLGAPVFLYYPPVYFYIVFLVQWVARDLWWAMALVDALAVAGVGAVGALVLSKAGVRGWLLPAGVVALAATPFAYMCVIHVQGLPWNLAYPGMLAAVGGYCLVRRGPVLVLLTATAVFLVTMTHVLSGFMTIVCFAGLGLVLLPTASRGDLRTELTRLFRVACGSLLGLLMSGVYLWPAVAALSLSNRAAYLGDVDWRSAFGLPIWSSFVHGTRWAFFQWWIAGLVLLLTAAATLVIVLHRRDDPREAARAAAVAWVAIFLSSDLSYPLWAASPVLRNLQYPYRFLCVGSLAAVLAATLALALLIRQRARGRWLRGLVAAPLAASLAATAAIETKLVSADGRPSREAFDFTAAIHGAPTYLPATIGPEWSDYVAGGGFDAVCAAARADCRCTVSEPQHRRWRMSSPSGWRARLPVFAFPAWRLWVNGKAVDWEVDPPTGVLTADLPAGEAQVELRWSALPQESTGRWLSAFGFLLWSALAVWSCRVSTQRRKDAKAQSPRPPD